MPFFILVKKQAFQVNDAIPQGDKNPIVIIVPGLTSASDSSVSYLDYVLFLFSYSGYSSSHGKEYS